MEFKMCHCCDSRKNVREMGKMEELWYCNFCIDDSVRNPSRYTTDFLGDKQMRYNFEEVKLEDYRHNFCMPDLMTECDSCDSEISMIDVRRFRYFSGDYCPQCFHKLRTNQYIQLSTINYLAPPYDVFIEIIG